MNIYAARKLQQALYKRGNVDHKHMLCRINKGELYYHNITRLSNDNFRTVDIDFLNALYQYVGIDDIKTTIFYNSGNSYNWPLGMYLAEIIKID